MRLIPKQPVIRPCSTQKFQRVSPVVPRFVVIRITPFAASVPYSVAADGPLMISMFSISSGLMSLRRDGAWPPVPSEDEATPPLARTPSMKMSGSFDSDTEFAPRMRMRVPVPVVPELWRMLTPAVRPCSRSERSEIGE